MSSGIVKWFDEHKGYGFIAPDDGSDDLFIHHSEIKTEGYASLDEGQKVQYEVGQGKKGQCVTNVTPCLPTIWLEDRQALLNGRAFLFVPSFEDKSTTSCALRLLCSSIANSCNTNPYVHLPCGSSIYVFCSPQFF